MNFKINFNIRLAVMLFAIIFLASCDDDKEMEIDSQSKSQLKIEMTDAPSDDPNVEAVVVTVVAIDLDGEVYTLPEPMSVEVSALTEGKVETVFDGEVAANSYNNISLIIDYDTDDNGQVPGCYVQTTDGVKHDLKASATASSKLVVKESNMTLEEGTSTAAVVDLDLRKCIKYDDGNTNDNYNFSTNLTSATRIVTANNTVKIEGQVNDELGYADDKVIVYVYEEGTFEANTETADDNNQFMSAVTSTEVKSDGTFSVNFLEEGNYEIKLVNYEKQDDDKLVAKSYLNASLTGSLDLSLITIDTDTNISILVTGVVQI